VSFHCPSETKPHLLTLSQPGDPFGAILVGGNTSLSPIQLRATVAAANIGGTIHVATLPSSEAGEEDKIVGVAVWFAPGQSLNSTVEQRSAGWDAFMDVVDDETRRWWLEYVCITCAAYTYTPPWWKLG
jgi:hypothetical protein